MFTMYLRHTTVPLLMLKKIALRQSRQNVVYRYEQCKLLAVRALNDCFAVFAVNIQCADSSREWDSKMEHLLHILT